MNKKNRLNSALNWIENDDYVADIGCDHGYLAILALKKGVKHLFLVDNKSGPLQKSMENLEPYKDDKSLEIQFSLSSGLKAVPSNFNKICILGMGGLLITQILEESANNLDNKTFILEANNKIPTLREYLFKNNFKIIDEQIVFDKDFYYELILCEKTKDKILYNYEDIFFGSVLRNKKDPLFIEKWTNRLDYLKNIRNNSKKRIDNIEEEISLIEGVLCLK